ncbi:hypothetical protein PAHAL_5G032400 [Panicum hallii]|uniref:Uncharacterized protein n=1 Tax=Panicum hallii TaxID=206008 RepID=A0A2T8IIR8_9POAL|nr:pectinesterase inhibitor 10-like [Panicum hallii]PVH37565.1 hypothetical protein PAHAL_5G032400 [Panicum hallii]
MAAGLAEVTVGSVASPAAISPAWVVFRPSVCSCLSSSTHAPALTPTSSPPPPPLSTPPSDTNGHPHSSPSTNQPSGIRHQLTKALHSPPPHPATVSRGRPWRLTILKNLCRILVKRLTGFCWSAQLETFSRPVYEWNAIEAPLDSICHATDLSR